MARPIKQGLDYYPYDVDADQDDKLGMIIGEFGEKGERLWQRMLAYTYKHNGYYMEWSEDVQLKFLRRYSYCGFNMSFLNEVVPRFIKWGLFDQSVFNAFQILTSKRIQSTWLDATRKRKGGIIDPRIWLLKLNVGIKEEVTRFPAEETTQKKEKKSKEKENGEKANSPPPEIPASLIKSIDALKADCLNDKVYFVEHVARQCRVPPETIPKLLEDFNAHLRSVGETTKGARDYRQHAQNWIKKQPITQSQSVAGITTRISLK